MIKNIIHLGSPVVLGIFFYIKNITDTLAGGIGLGTFLVLLFLGLIYNYNQKYNPKSETEYFVTVDADNIVEPVSNTEIDIEFDQEIVLTIIIGTLYDLLQYKNYC